MSYTRSEGEVDMNIEFSVDKRSWHERRAVKRSSNPFRDVSLIVITCAAVLLVQLIVRYKDFIP